jgi:lipopolysaccharide export system permease protein
MITFFIAMFFLIMQFLWKYVDDFMGKGLAISVILELLFYVSATLIPLALPLAVLFSSIMTFGNLAEKNELTALKSSGLSLFRIMRPMLIFVLMLSGFAFYFTNYILPLANLKSRTLIYNIQVKKPTFGITEGIFYNDIDNYSIRVAKKNDNTGILEDILIYETLTANKGKTIKAEKGEMLQSQNRQYLLLKLVNGSIYEQLPQDKKNNLNAPYQKTNFSEAILKFDMGGFEMKQESEDLFKREFEMMNFRQLDYALDSLIVKFDKDNEAFKENMLRQVAIFNPSFRNINKDSTRLLEKEEGMVKIDSIISLSDLSKMEYLSALQGAQGKIRASKNLINSQTIIHRSNNSTIANYKAAWHKKFTLSFAIIILFFIGAPLGAIIRKGGLGAPLVFAVLFFLLYYILSISGENMVESGFITVWKGMWLSSFVLVPLGIFLTYKSANDSALFDIDIYKRFTRKFFNKKDEH